ncbi:hypothetical protein ACWDTT_32790, partial [Streptosporangium sandarakinum]
MGVPAGVVVAVWWFPAFGLASGAVVSGVLKPAIRFIIFWASKKRVTRPLTSVTVTPEPPAGP